MSAFAVTAALVSGVADASSLRFYGTGVNDIDRVKIRIDDPNDPNDVGPPADIGATDFTIEFWLLATADNNSLGRSCTSNNWIYGNIVYDRDIFSGAPAYGVSLANGRLTFGMKIGQAAVTICGFTDLRDGVWHHVALQRRLADGWLWLYVDGSLEAQTDGPDGDASYPNSRYPGNFCNGPCTNSDPFIVIAAEKHDASANAPSFHGWIDEVRLSTTLRYAGAFTRPSQPFVTDTDTAALYHFDEGTGAVVTDSSRTTGENDGEIKFGMTPPRPEWSTLTPFTGPAAGQVQFDSGTFTVGENQGGVTIRVNRIGGNQGVATVDYSSADGTAMAGSDYTAVASTLSWADGAAGQMTFVVAIADDNVVEANETVQLTLSNATTASLGNPAAAGLSIIDDDSAQQSPGSLSFDNGALSRNESAGSVLIGVTRSGGVLGQVTADYSVVGGSATGGADFAPLGGTLTWPNGAAGAQTFSVSLVDDSLSEGAETIVLGLANITGGAALGAVATATLTIGDNDTQPAASGGSSGGGSTGIAWLVFLSAGLLWWIAVRETGTRTA